MIFNSQTILIAAFLLLIIAYLTVKYLFKTRKRSAESIYKLIDDLEKKYIY